MLKSAVLTLQQRWFTYSGLSDDIIAGVITGLVLIPQALAYASLAGLPAHIGLYASLLPPIVYALFASSNAMSVGPVSVAAIMVADAYRQAAVQTSADAISVSVVLSLEVGAILLLLRALKLGMMNSLLSHTVLSGFTSAAAVLIILSQFDKIVGASAADLLARFFHNATAAPVNSYTLIIGAGLLTFAVVARKLLLANSGSWPAFATRLLPLVLLIAGVALVAHPEVRAHIAIVGPIPAIFPSFQFTLADLDTWRLLLPSALAIALVGYIESLSVARILAAKRHESIDANRELLALGAANFASGFSGAMPVAGGFSRSMVNHASGAKTQRATLVTVAVIVLAALFARNFIENIPLVVLAVVITLAVAPLIDLKTLRDTWRYDHAEAIVIAITFAAVLLVGLEFGLLLGVLSAFVLYFKRSLQPHIAELGRLPGRSEYRNILRYQTHTDEAILVLRIDENLYFANIGLIESQILKTLSARKTIKHLLLVCNAVNHIDSHALHLLQRLVTRLHAMGVTIHFAEVKGPVQDRLRKAGFEQQLSARRFFFTIQDAVDYIHETQNNPEEETPHGQENA